MRSDMSEAIYLGDKHTGNICGSIIGSDGCTKNIVNIYLTDAFCQEDDRFRIMQHASLNGKRVLVKYYTRRSKSLTEKNEKYLRDLAVYRAFHHANLPQLIGYSLESEPYPFLVFGGVISRDVSGFVQAQMIRGQVESFMAALNVISGVALGLVHLRSRCHLSRSLIESCMKKSNLLIGKENRVIVGENLLLEVPDLCESHDGPQYESYISEEFWYLTREIALETHDPSCWSHVGGLRQTSHLRILLALCAWTPDITLTKISDRLNCLHEMLEETRRKQRVIQFSDIRDALLRLRDFSHNYTFRPPDRWDVSPCDLGYVRGGMFVRLYNVEKEAELNVGVNNQAVVKCEPHGKEAGSERISDDVIRHKFVHVSYVGLQYRNERKVLNSPEAVQFLRREGPSLIRQYGRKHGISLHDLIVVTGTMDQLRTGSFRWVDDTREVIDEVYLYEYADPERNPWGVWSINRDQWLPESGATDHRMQGICILHPQIVTFVQLEIADFESDTQDEMECHVSPSTRASTRLAVCAVLLSLLPLVCVVCVMFGHITGKLPGLLWSCNVDVA